MNENGFIIIPRLLSHDDCDALLAALGPSSGAPVLSRSRRPANRRHLLRDVPLLGEFARSAALTEVAGRFTGGPAFPVRALLFDKTPEANWSVGWHQDTTIAVRERLEVEGFHGWSIKEGVLHAQAPAGILEQMVAIRLHLDDCPEDNGALRVLPGSHRDGKLDEADATRWLKAVGAVACPVPRGGALVLRPLLLHASSRAGKPDRRRVIHLEYAGHNLPGGLEWAEWASRGAPRQTETP
jgi:hypothetical protein